MAVDHASSSLLLELEDEHGEALSLLSDGNDNAADRARALSATKRGVEYVSASIGDSNEDDDENSSRRRKIRYEIMDMRNTSFRLNISSDSIKLSLMSHHAIKVSRKRY